MNKIEYLKLGDIATFVNGYAFKSSNWKSEGLPIIRIQNLNNINASFNYFQGDIDEKYFVNKGDILISWSASIGIYEWEKDKAVLNQHIYKVIFNKIDISKDYFKYSLDYVLSKELKNMHGSTMKHFTKNTFENIKLPVPNVEQQIKIAKLLRKCKNLIHYRNSQIKAMKELKKSIFLSMFGDLQLNTKKWEKGKVRDLTEITQYGSSKKADEKKGHYPMLRMNNITYDGELKLEDLKYVDLDKAEKEKYLVYKGDLLFNRTNSKELVGKATVYDRDTPMAYAGYLVKLTPNNLANSTFISGYLNSSYGKRYLYNLAKNIVGMANINAKELQAIPIIIPPIELQNDYKAKIIEINKQLDELKVSIDGYQNLYDSLMQKTIKGNLIIDT